MDSCLIWSGFNTFLLIVIFLVHLNITKKKYNQGLWDGYQKATEIMREDYELRG